MAPKHGQSGAGAPPPKRRVSDDKAEDVLVSVAAQQGGKDFEANLQSMVEEIRKQKTRTFDAVPWRHQQGHQQ